MSSNNIVVFEVDTGISKKVLKGVTCWEEVPSALYREDIVNMGEVRVYELEYQLISTTPHVIDTKY